MKTRIDIFQIIEKGNLAQLKEAIAGGANVNAKDDIGWRPLQSAIYYSYVGIAKLLLEKGAEVNANDNLGLTALHWARHPRDGGLLLLKNGANVNSQSKDGWTPLHFATKYCHLAMVRILLKNGANANVKSKHGFTPLQVASYCGHRAIVRLLEAQTLQQNLPHH